MNTPKMVFYSDTQHGWLAVKKKVLKDLGIENQISQFSYMKGLTVYLEADCDLSLFVKVFESKYGKTLNECIAAQKHCNNSSPIRSYDRYKAENEVTK